MEGKSEDRMYVITGTFSWRGSDLDELQSMVAKAATCAHEQGLTWHGGHISTATEEEAVESLRLPGEPFRNLTAQGVIPARGGVLAGR